MRKLAIITTHPIQYNAPWFKMLTERGHLRVKVFYTWGQLETDQKYDPDFRKNVIWDIPLTEGYDFSFIKNVAKKPGSDHYTGIDNPSLNTEVEEWKPDAVLVIGWKFKSHLKALRYFNRKSKVLFRGDSTLLDEKGKFLKEIIRQLILKKVYSFIDHALYVGAANKSYFLKMGLTENQLTFVPHAIDNHRFAIENFSIRSRIGIPENASLVLFSGKLEEKKNPLLLLNAFIASRTDAHLLFVGDGTLMRALKDRIAKLAKHVRERIHLMGFQNQSLMPSIYQACDIFVLPSQGPGETWGLAVNEAMASGCAVLVSDKCGCYADLVKTGTNGFVFKSGNTVELTSLMEKMLADKNRLKEMGKASKELIKKYSFEKICAALETLIL